MNRHPPGTAVFKHYLQITNIDEEINAMLDNPAWNPRRIPGSLSWIHSESITFIGDIMVAIIMEILNISPQRLMAHIRKIYATEMAFVTTFELC